ncbi:hypothetical protein FGO68_gene17601 [Halteria grandinella]|uniref:J domain-containing protein n=1 Tax=Halteria grandinella TaxID=5974 RepID=A0A8J8NG75_HALGN|nr:hypothetical protein FGO68_gene17601 [Halteria grandinella]
MRPSWLRGGRTQTRGTTASCEINQLMIIVKCFNNNGRLTGAQRFVRCFSKFDYQEFEEEIRQRRQKSKNEQKKTFPDQDEQSQDSSSGSSNSYSNGEKASVITLPQNIARDLTLLNVPKYVSREDLKKQYHKLAKIYHPDVMQKHEYSENQRLKMEERFKEFNQAYERLVKWVGERDKTLDDDLLKGLRPGVKVNREDGSVTYTIGKLQLEGKRSTLDRQQLLLEMIEDDLNLKEPVNFKRYLIGIWLLFGAYVFYKDFKSYYAHLSTPLENVDYTQSYFKLIQL